MRSWRKGSRRVDPQNELLLAAMVDMMVNVLLFLLTLYGAANAGGDLQLPEGSSKADAGADVELTITQESVSIEGTPVLDVQASGGWASLSPDALTHGLDLLADKLRARREDFGDAPRLAVQIDRRIPWSVVEPLIGVAGEAGFVDLHFVVTSVSQP
jgi:biopolymer transport protein ExbD